MIIDLIFIVLAFTIVIELYLLIKMLQEQKQNPFHVFVDWNKAPREFFPQGVGEHDKFKLQSAIDSINQNILIIRDALYPKTEEEKQEGIKFGDKVKRMKETLDIKVSEELLNGANKKI